MEYGILKHFNTTSALFTHLFELFCALSKTKPNAWIGLSGGTTPKAFYSWILKEKAREAARMFPDFHWSISDERAVSLLSEESNFGTAQRSLLEPLCVPPCNQHPWRPNESAEDFSKNLPETLFDLCLLGMGEDGHTASLFPNSPLLLHPVEAPFAQVEVPGVGPRLTITPAGLKRCGKIIVLVTGSKKKEKLHAVLEAPLNPLENPVQCLHAFADKTCWVASP